MSAEKRCVGIVGAGTMGSGIAQLLAMAGHEVVLRDLTQEAVDRGMKGIAQSAERLSSKGRLSVEASQGLLAQIRPTLELRDVANCDIVIEAIVENYEAKASLVRELDEVCRETAILATNTSSISVTRIASASKDPSRVIGMHFFNPVVLMDLVEIIPAMQTSDATREKVVSLTESIGKTPKLTQDSYGFVVNRILIPMVNEAINCLHEGVASAKDIDDMMKLGANHPLGPLSLADLIGLDVVRSIMETLQRGFDDPKYRPSPLLKRMCDAGYLGRKTGRGFFTYSK